MFAITFFLCIISNQYFLRKQISVIKTSNELEICRLLNRNRFRISFHGNISTATVQPEMLTTPKANAPTPKPTVVEEKRNVIVLKEDGYIDTVKTRIDFFKDTWYDEFLQIQDALANYNNTSEESIRQDSAS